MNPAIKAFPGWEFLSALQESPVLPTAKLVGRVSVLALSLATAHAGDFDTDHVRAACPGIAAWQKDHPDVPAVSRHEAGANPKLATQLHTMAAEDQDARNFDPLKLNEAAFRRVERIDRKNDKTLRAMVKRYGIPTVASIGTEGMADFWLLVQHADRDVHLQESVLRKFEDGESGASLSEVAYLQDRVLSNQGKPQLFGTQFQSTDGGPLKVKEIEDPEHLAERRAKMGLMPFPDYECGIRALYPDPTVPAVADHP